MILAGGHGRRRGRGPVPRRGRGRRPAAAPEHRADLPQSASTTASPFFEMEYVEGGSLARAARRHPVAARRAAARLVDAVARAVDEAHRQRVVHRDLKPANILLTADGSPKVTDFGLAKSLEAGADLTTAGVILGTPSYMAPEQAEGGVAGRRPGGRRLRAWGRSSTSC